MARNNPLPPTLLGAAVRLAVYTQTQLQTCITLFDYITSSGGTPSLSDLQLFVGRWRTLNETLFAACLSTSTNITQYIASELKFGTTPSAVETSSLPVPGTVSGTNLPIEMAATVIKTSTLKGQHGRGRNGFPAVPASFVTPATNPNTLNASALTAYAALYNSILSGLTTGFGTWGWAILTRPEPPVTLYSFGIDVASYSITNVLGTVRLRKIGRGI